MEHGEPLLVGTDVLEQAPVGWAQVGGDVTAVQRTLLGVA